MGIHTDAYMHAYRHAYAHAHTALPSSPHVLLLPQILGCLCMSRRGWPIICSMSRASSPRSMKNADIKNVPHMDLSGMLAESLSSSPVWAWQTEWWLALHGHNIYNAAWLNGRTDGRMDGWTDGIRDGHNQIHTGTVVPTRKLSIVITSENRVGSFP